MILGSEVLHGGVYPGLDKAFSEDGEVQQIGVAGKDYVECKRLIKMNTHDTSHSGRFEVSIFD